MAVPRRRIFWLEELAWALEKNTRIGHTEKKAKLVQYLERRHEYREKREKHHKREAEKNHQLIESITSMSATFALEEKRKLYKMRL